MSPRNRISIADHRAFRQSLVPREPLDEIDRELDDFIVIDPFNGDPPSRRSDRELNRILSILDEIDSGKGSQ